MLPAVSFTKLNTRLKVNLKTGSRKCIGVERPGGEPGASVSPQHSSVQVSSTKQKPGILQSVDENHTFHQPTEIPPYQSAQACVFHEMVSDVSL